MLTAIVQWSLRHRSVVVVLACVLLGYCVYSLEQAKYDVFPEFSPPQVETPNLWQKAGVHLSIEQVNREGMDQSTGEPTPRFF